MAQFTYYPATNLFNNIPPNTKNLNHDIQEFLRHRSISVYYAQSWSVQEPAFIKNPKKPCMVNIEKSHEKRTSKLFITNEKLRMCI